MNNAAESHGTRQEAALYLDAKPRRTEETMTLTAKQIEKLRKVPGRYLDERGLYLLVPAPKGKTDKRARGSWLLRYEIQVTPEPNANTWLKRHGRQERWMGLGSLADFTLKEARERARAKRQLLADGIDPLDQKLANDG
jgi:Arm DNA-binding domain